MRCTIDTLLKRYTACLWQMEWDGKTDRYPTGNMRRRNIYRNHLISHSDISIESTRPCTVSRLTPMFYPFSGD